MKQVAVASHIALVKNKEYDGIGNVMIATLSSLTDSFTFVRHSMDGHLPSEIQMYHKQKVTRRINLRVLSNLAPLRYLTEVISTVLYFSIKQRVDVYVGIDPLNALAGVVLKKLRRVDKAIFYTADYSPSRFDSSLLNKIYHWIDVYCVNNADEVWSVSSKIVDIRKSMGLVDEKNVFIPNVPPVEYNSFRKNNHHKHTLITYGIVDKQLDFEGAIRAVAYLKRDIKDIRFIIVGNGPEETRLKRLAKDLDVVDKVDFMGRQSLAVTLELASRAGIGLALYTGVWGFNKYGDSTKCREYFNYGLPVISTDTHSTVEEMVKGQAGIVVEKSVDEYVRAIKKIIDQYDEYSRCSSRLGIKYEGIHRRLLQRTLQN